MARSGLFVRRAVVAAWQAYAPLLALVPASRIFPPQRPAKPEWPFVGYGVPNELPFEASCLDGSTIEFAGHAYAETTGSDDDTVGGEEMAGRIADAMVAALEAAGPLNLAAHGSPRAGTAYVTWTGTQVIQDGSEADNFHAVVLFRVTVST
jgi:hypothetical protein